MRLYREEFKPNQGGQIGLTLNGDWQMPWDDNPESEPCSSTKVYTYHLFFRPDVEAAQHALDTAIGWFADPIYLGQYPPYLRQMLGDRLPEFTDEEIRLVQGSSDFYGMNTYTTNLCRKSVLFSRFRREELTDIRGGRGRRVSGTGRLYFHET